MTLATPAFDFDLRPEMGVNRLLAALTPTDYAHLAPHLKPTTLERDRVLFEPGDDIAVTHFPCEGAVTAILIVGEDGRQIEAATIGREGAIGGIVSHGHRPAFGRGVVQISGQALRLSTDRLEEAKQRSPRIADLFNRYADYLLAQVMQFSACNALHTVEQRLCRVLLMAQDRTGDDVLDFTQQALADALGVQRTSVTGVAHFLEEQGLLRTRRGRIQLLDRSGLMRRACECNAALENHFGRLASGLGS